MTDAAWQSRRRRRRSRAHRRRSATGSRRSRSTCRPTPRSADDLVRALAAATGRTAVYFALPPAIALLACKALSDDEAAARHRARAREAVRHRPAQSAHALNRLLETIVPEEQVFRVDHFLGKSTVLNLIGLRFANRHLRAAAVGAERRERRDRLRGGARARGPRRLLRPGRRADRHDPEPPAAGARARHDGAAVERRRRGPARRDGAGAARDAAVEEGRHREPPGPLHGGQGRPPQAARVRRRAGRRSRARAPRRWPR